MSGKSHDEIWAEWSELVNIPPAELEDWLKSEESRSVGDSGDASSTGHKSGERIVALRRTRKAELSEDDWDHMGKVVGYIKRHCAQGGPAEDVETSKWRHSLMNWGHDPLREGGCAR